MLHPGISTSFRYNVRPHGSSAVLYVFIFPLSWSVVSTHKRTSMNMSPVLLACLPAFSGCNLWLALLCADSPNCAVCACKYRNTYVLPLPLANASTVSSLLLSQTHVTQVPWKGTFHENTAYKYDPTQAESMDEYTCTYISVNRHEFPLDRQVACPLQNTVHIRIEQSF